MTPLILLHRMTLKGFKVKYKSIRNIPNQYIIHIIYSFRLELIIINAKLT